MAHQHSILASVSAGGEGDSEHQQLLQKQVGFNGDKVGNSETVFPFKAHYVRRQYSYLKHIVSEFIFPFKAHCVEQYSHCKPTVSQW